MFINNQIDPNYKAQNQTNNESVVMQLAEDLIAFRFEYSYNLSVDVLEKQTNKTYIVYQAFYLNQNDSSYDLIQIDIVKCKTPTLQGYYCLDFSKSPNQTLFTNNIQNIQSQVQISTYGCLDTDFYKTTIPNNCADAQDIDKVVNALNSGIKIKIKTSQYNTTSKKIETSYRSSFIVTLQTQLILTTIKVQQQISSVKEGLFVQSQTDFTSALSYEVQNQSLDRSSAKQYSNLGSFSQVNIFLDELYSQIQIQYTTIPLILSQVNGVFQLLILFGFIARYFSQNSIKKNFFVAFLQSMYLEKYIQMLKFNKYYTTRVQLVSEQNEQLQNLKGSENLDEKQIQENSNLNDIHNTQFKQKSSLDFKNFKSQNAHHLDLLPIFSQTDGQEVKINQIIQSNNENEIMMQQKIIQNNLNTIFNETSYSQNKQNQSQMPCLLENKISFIRNTNQINKNKTKEHSDKLHKKDTDFEQIQQDIKTASKISRDIQDSNNYLSLIKAIKNKNISSQIQNIIFRPRFCKMKNATKQEEINSSQIKKIESQIIQDLDIFQLYKDILFLKKAVMLLFSQEQLASLQLVGCPFSFLDFDKNQSENQSQKNKINHYEEQLKIYLSDDIHSKYVQKFFQRCQKSINLSKIDQRILSSLPTNVYPQ